MSVVPLLLGLLIASCAADTVHYAFRTEHTTATLVQVRRIDCTRHIPCWGPAVVRWDDRGQVRYGPMRSGQRPGAFVSMDPDASGLIGQRFKVAYRHGDPSPTMADDVSFGMAVTPAGLPVFILVGIYWWWRVRSGGAARSAAVGPQA